MTQVLALVAASLALLVVAVDERRILMGTERDGTITPGEEESNSVEDSPQTSLQGEQTVDSEAFLETPHHGAAAKEAGIKHKNITILIYKINTYFERKYKD